MRQKSWQPYSIELAKAKIKFYEPFSRLILRKIVQDVLINTSALRLDLFAIFDSVNKRGGFVKVQQLKRWTQVQYSLPYYKCNFRQIYTEHILKRENQVKKHLKLYNRQYKVIEQTFVELHYVAATSSGGYYHFEDDQNSFCKQNFANVDLFMNIKTISLSRVPPLNIIYQYSDKYLLTRKWLIMKGYSKPQSDKQLDQLQIMKIYNNNASIALIGWNLANVLLALKLHELKFNVVLYTNLQKKQDAKYLQRNLCVQEGVFLLDDGVGGPFSYSQLLKQNKVQLTQISNYCGFIDSGGRTVPQFRVRQSQQLFLALLADFKFQQLNRKPLKTQLIGLLGRKKLNDELNLTNWHLQRYLMLNNLQGQDTTVHNHYSYLSRRKHKIFMSKKRPIYINSCIKLVQKALKSFTLVHQKPRVIDFCNNMWFIEQRVNQKRSFSSLIYSDSQQVFEMVSKKIYKVPSMQHQNFVILQDLLGSRWINCHFRFKEKLKIKEGALSQVVSRKRDFQRICQYDLSEQNCSFQFDGKFGFYYYFVVEEGYGLMASCRVQKFLSNSSTSFQLKSTLCTQILKQFQINMVSLRLPELEQPQVIEYSHFFSMKQEALSRDRIVKLKNWERMYLSIGFPWALNCNKLTSQIDVSNQILALITNAYYHLYKFDERARQNFSAQYRLGSSQIAKKQQESQALTQSKPKQQNQHNARKQATAINQPTENNMVQKSVPIQCTKMIPETYQQESTQKLQIRAACKVHPQKDQIFNGQRTFSYKGLNGDPFGFNNYFIKTTFQYLHKQVATLNIEFQQRIQQYQQSGTGRNSPFKPIQDKVRELIIKFQDTFQLQQPLKLYKNTFLHSIGKVMMQIPSIKESLFKLRLLQNQISNLPQNLDQLKEKCYQHQIKICLFDGYMTKRQFYSLQNPNTTTIYVNCVLYIQKQNSKQTKPYFIIFQESNLALFYYHTSLGTLTDAFNAYIQKKRKLSKSNQAIYRGDYRTNLYANSSKMTLMLNKVRHKIEEQIKFSDKEGYLSQQQMLDRILSQKLKAEVPQQVYQDPSQNDLYSKIALIEGNQQKTLFLIDALNQLTRYQLEMNGIKSDITLVDIFFGYLSEGYFIFQILCSKFQQSLLNKKTESPFDKILQQMKQKDPHLYNQISQILEKMHNIQSEDYFLSLQYDCNSLTVQRKFLTGKNDNLTIKSGKNQQIQFKNEQKLDQDPSKDEKLNEECYFVQKAQQFKKYIFIKQFNLSKQGQKNDKTRCYLMIGQNQSRIDLDPKENPLELILSILVDTWDQGQIYDHFKRLIKKQIWSCQHCLPKRLKLYYQSTRKKINTLNIYQVDQLRRSMLYRKVDVLKGKISKGYYATQYCTDEDDKQTIYQHLQDGSMVFVDGQVVICRN